MCLPHSSHSINVSDFTLFFQMIDFSFDSHYQVLYLTHQVLKHNEEKCLKKQQLFLWYKVSIWRHREQVLNHIYVTFQKCGSFSLAQSLVSIHSKVFRQYSHHWLCNRTGDVIQRVCVGKRFSSNWEALDRNALLF